MLQFVAATFAALAVELLIAYSNFASKLVPLMTALEIWWNETTEPGPHLTVKLGLF